jgi:hypothetical protein
MERCEACVFRLSSCAVDPGAGLLHPRDDRHAGIEQDEQHDETADESPK